MEIKYEKYHFVIRLLTTIIIIFNFYLFFIGDLIVKLYSILVFPTLFNSWIASEQNESSDNFLFSFIDTVILGCFYVTLLYLDRHDYIAFWIGQSCISILYIVWNITYSKLNNVPKNEYRVVGSYNIVWGFSIFLNIIYIAFHRYGVKINDWLYFILFLPWIYNMLVWYRLKILSIANINFSNMNIKCYSFNEVNEEFYIKRIRLGISNSKGKIKSIIKSSKIVKKDIDYYMLPGLIDCHQHISDSPYNLLKSEDFKKENFDNALERFKNNLSEALDYGITSIKDMGGFDFNNMHFVDEIEKDSKTFSPRTVTTGCYFSDSKYAHFMDRGGIIIKTKAEAEKVAEYLKMHNIQYVKFMLGEYEDKDDIDDNNEPKLKRAYENNFFEIASVFKDDFIVSVHAFELIDVQKCYTLNGTQPECCVHIIEHLGGYLDKGIQENTEIIKNIKHCKTIITSTYIGSYDGINIPNPAVSVSDDVSLDILTKWNTNLKTIIPKIILDDEICLAIGTDSGLYGTPCSSTIEELICIHSLCEHLEGYSFKRVLEKMYKNSANALALGSSIGGIAEGKYCDFVLYEEDPMENPRILYKPSEVYIAGKRVR
jgi:hypothetical protein